MSAPFLILDAVVGGRKSLISCDIGKNSTENITDATVVYRADTTAGTTFVTTFVTISQLNG